MHSEALVTIDSHLRGQGACQPPCQPVWKRRTRPLPSLQAAGLVYPAAVVAAVDQLLSDLASLLQAHDWVPGACQLRAAAACADPKSSGAEEQVEWCGHGWWSGGGWPA